MRQRHLKDMTLAELWELFPIVLTPHNPDWSEWVDDEMFELSTERLQSDCQSYRKHRHPKYPVEADY